MANPYQDQKFAPILSRPRMVSAEFPDCGAIVSPNMAFVEIYDATPSLLADAASVGTVSPTNPAAPPHLAAVARPSDDGAACATQPPGVPPQAALTRRAPADVRLPCMVYAAVGALANPGAQVVDQAMSDARRAPGVVNVYTYPGGTVEGSLACEGGVAVVTRGYWLARQTLARLMDQCGPALRPAALDGAQVPADRAMEANLTAASAACTVQWYNGQLRIWMTSSDPARVVAAAARIAGCRPEVVDLRLLGDADAVHGLAPLVPAIALARALQSAPVQLIVAYDLGLHCQPPADTLWAMRESVGRTEDVARAA